MDGWMDGKITAKYKLYNGDRSQHTTYFGERLVSNRFDALSDPVALLPVLNVHVLVAYGATVNFFQTLC